MQSKETIIHIDWSGPFTVNEVVAFNGPTDFGVYQIYGAHHVYGSDSLLYIGLAEAQPFATRLAQHRWCPVNHDAGRLQFYLGRFFGGPTPKGPQWSQLIKLAERLLIQAHKPAENSMKELGALEPELWHVHVLNWSQYRDLLPEVSGARWSNRFESVPCRPHFSTEEMMAPTALAPAA
jgi:hypothetical protein